MMIGGFKMDNELRNLYFIQSDGGYRLLQKKVTRVMAVRLIREFLSCHNFKSHYTRIWDIEEGTMFDVGSHTEFFLWGFENAGGS